MVLVVDDENAIRRFLWVASNGQNFTVIEATTGETALQALTIKRSDLLILDLGLPDIDGVEAPRRFREGSQVPGIILSDREQEEDKIAVLDAGADDYLTEFFGVGELLARIRTVMHRQNSNISKPIFKIGDLWVDLANRLVKVNNQEIQLKPTEYDLLVDISYFCWKSDNQPAAASSSMGEGLLWSAHFTG